MSKEEIELNQFVHDIAQPIYFISSLKNRQLAGVEEEFLHAAEFGDIPNVKRLIDTNSDLNTDCIDALGRTALRLAVKNEHLEVSFCLRCHIDSRLDCVCLLYEDFTMH